MGRNGSKTCENGNVIRDKDLCKQICEKYNIPIANGFIDGSNCYKNRENKCYQNDFNGDRASLICRKSNDGNGNLLQF